MNTASREAVSHQAHLAGNGLVDDLAIAKRCNTAGDRFPARPKGASQMIQYGVAVLDKGTTILCGQRLVLNHLANSESVNIILKEYWSPTDLNQSVRARGNKKPAETGFWNAS